MPTYDEYEESIASSAPVECYKFVGSFKTYYYTSADEKKTVDSIEYIPVNVTRSNVKAGTQEEKTLSIDLEIPFDTPVVLDYAFSQTPPKLQLEVYRFQEDDPTALSLFWKGTVRGFNISGRKAKIQVPSIFSLALQNEAPNVYYQTPCNHVLYDIRCGVSRALNSFDAIVLGVSGTTITLTTSPTTTDDLKAGEIVNTRNGERRLVVSNDTDTVTIGYPFVDLIAGDEVELVRGCDHAGRNGDCKLKFNNYINFGGHEDIPPDNPFEGEIN